MHICHGCQHKRVMHRTIIGQGDHLGGCAVEGCACEAFSG